MKTKIVYVACSLKSDCYIEQAFISAWSVRQYNKDCQIIMVCDQDTYATFGTSNRQNYKYLFDSFIVKDFNEDQGMMERSRVLKTTLRNIIEGDFLFIDTDTIVCKDLSYIDDFPFNLGMVLDNNCIFNKAFLYDSFVRRTKKLYGIDIAKEKNYYNSGVIFARDTPSNREFYSYWHNLWKSKCHDEACQMKDQFSLMATDMHFEHRITEMNGDMNCQVLSSIQYLHTASILHIYRSWSASGKFNEVFPLVNDNFYENIKEEGITEDVKSMVVNAKSQFSSPTMIVSGELAYYWFTKCNMDALSSNWYHLFMHLHRKHPIIYNTIESFCAFIRNNYQKTKKKNN